MNDVIIESAEQVAKANTKIFQANHLLDTHKGRVHMS